MIILLILFVIIVIFFFFYYKKNGKEKIQEGFTEEDELKFCDINTNRTNFCNWNGNDKTCYCSFQPGLTQKNFPQNPDCCQKHCSGLSKEECQSDPNQGNIKYYCPINGRCKEFLGYKYDTKISANTCGYNKLNYQTIYPFLSKRDCELSIEPCAEYNSDELTVSEQKDKCLEKEFCGWCTNNLGTGQCISGTVAGPIDIYKYNFCKIDNANSSFNSYTHKGPDTFDIPRE